MGKREDDLQGGYDAVAAALEQAVSGVETANARIVETLRPSVRAIERLEAPLSPRQRAEALLRTLPSAMRIGPHDWAIELMAPDDADSRRLDGHHSPNEGKMRLSSTFPSSTRAAVVLLHECLHALYDAAGLEDGDKEERVVDVLSTGLVALLRDNPWLFAWLDGAVR